MKTDMTPWTGRVDPEPDTHRWHQQVQPLEQARAPGAVLIEIGRASCRERVSKFV